MKYMLLLLFMFFYKFIINDKIKCSENKEDFSLENDESKINILESYNEESRFIHLKNQSLSLLPPEISKFTKLEKFFLNHNDFSEIPVVLSKFEALESINMYKNKLKSFPNEVIILRNLKFLFLANNEITFLKPSFYENHIFYLNAIYPSLEILDLSHNNIEYIPILQSKTLKILYLRGNEILNIHTNMFIGLEKIEFLGLPLNNLKEIDNNIHELQSLKNIDLYNNKIRTFILNKDCLENLTYLNLNSNQIKKFNLGKSIVPQIKTISLTNNRLSSIPSDIYNLTSLEILYLPYNKITELHDLISNLINLTSLKLSGNNISKIPLNFYTLKSLEIIDISYNNITEIHDSISNLTKLKILDLYCNI